MMMIIITTYVRMNDRELQSVRDVHLHVLMLVKLKMTVERNDVIE